MNWPLFYQYFRLWAAQEYLFVDRFHTSDEICSSYQFNYFDTNCFLSVQNIWEQGEWYVVTRALESSLFCSILWRIVIFISPRWHVERCSLYCHLLKSLKGQPNSCILRYYCSAKCLGVRRMAGQWIRLKQKPMKLNCKDQERLTWWLDWLWN